MVDEIKTWLSGKRSYTEGVQLYVKHGNDKGLKEMFLWEPWSAFKEAKLLKVLQELAPPEPVTYRINATAHLVPIGTTKLGPAQLEKIDWTPKIEILGEDVQNLNDKISDLADEQNYSESRIDDLEYAVKDLPDIESIKKDVAHLKNNTVPKSKGWPQVMDSTMQQLHREWLPLFNEKKNLQARLHDIAAAGTTDPEKKDEPGAMAAKILDLRDAIRKIYAKRDAYKATGKLPEEKKLFDLDIPTDPNKWPITLANYQRYVRDYKAKLKSKPGNENFKKQLAKYEWGVAEVKKLLGIE